MEKPGLYKQKLKTVPQWNLSKEADPDCFSQIFAITKKLPGFSISSLAYVEDFFNVCKYMYIYKYM